MEKTKEKSGNFSARRITLGGVILLSFGLLYVPSLINWLLGNNVATDIIRNGVIEESVNTSGIIIRDEEFVEYSVFDGALIPKIAEGEKAAANSIVATVMNSTSNALLEEIEEINEKIVKSQMEKAEKVDFFSEDIVKLDGEVGANVQKLISACSSGNFKELRRYRSEIVKIIEKKAEIIGDDSTDSYISALNTQKEKLEHEIRKNTANIVSNNSGIVSYIIDGYEGILTPKGIADLSPGKFEKLQKEHANEEQYASKGSAEKPRAKIIKGTDIYISALIKEKDLNKFKLNQSIKLRISGQDFEHSAVVMNISDVEAGNAVVTVRATRGLDTLSHIRMVSVDFINKTEEGLKVPLKSLADISPDGSTAQIMLVKYNVSTLRDVEVLSMDKEYAIITTSDKSVNLYDTYIINPLNVNEGVIIDK